MSDHEHRPDSLPEHVERMFDRVASGEANEAEVQAYRDWEGVHPGIARQLAIVRRVVTEHDDPVYGAARAAQIAARSRGDLRESSGETSGIPAQARLVRRMADRGTQVGRGGRSGLGSRTLRQRIGSFVSVVALIAVFFVFRFAAGHASGTSRTYTTGIDQQGILVLDDSTRVILAPRTTLRLLGFSRQARTVSVDGRAYFEVTRAEGVPFEVRSGPVITRVLGTAFLIDHAPQSSHVRIAVEEGKVHVSIAARGTAGLTVAAGYVGDITDSSMIVNAVTDSGSRTEWVRGKLVFHHAPVGVVLQTLSRWYGYQFRYADSTLPQRSVTIGVSVSSAASALATLEQILRVNLTLIGDTVTLTPSVHGHARDIPKVRSYDVWTPTREVGR